MNYHMSLAGLAIMWFMVVIIPGPNFLVVSQTALSSSRISGFTVALGVSLGAATWALVGLAGFAVVLQTQVAWIYIGLHIAGGCYLIFLGGRVIANSLVASRAVDGSLARINLETYSFFRGLMTSYSNPKTMVFFASVFVLSFPLNAPIWFYGSTIGMVFSVSLFWYGNVVLIFSIPQLRKFYFRFRHVVSIP